MHPNADQGIRYNLFMLLNEGKKQSNSTWNAVWLEEQYLEDVLYLNRTNVYRYEKGKLLYNSKQI